MTVPQSYRLLLSPASVAVGLVSSLVQQGVLQRPAQLAGSSAGSLIAASFNAGQSPTCMLL